MTRRRYWVYFLLFLLSTISYTDRVNMSVAGHAEAERKKILAERHVTQAAGPGVGYRGLLHSPSMWGLAISQGCAVYSLYLYLSWLPDYLQTQRHVSMVHSGLFTSVPFLVGAVVIIVVNWFGDFLLSPDGLRAGKRRNVVIVCLVLGGNVFGLLAPIVTGYQVAATGSFVSAFVLAGVLALVGAALSFGLTRFPIGKTQVFAPARA